MAEILNTFESILHFISFKTFKKGKNKQKLVHL